MIKLKRGQCFYNPKNGDYVYIVDRHCGIYDNLFYCYVLEMEEDEDYTNISDALYTGHEISEMAYMFHESEDYMKKLRDDLMLRRNGK